MKVEYSRELRENTQLAALIPRIASNIDAMLNRHNIVSGIDSLQVYEHNSVDKVNRIKHGKNNTKFKSSREKNYNPVKRSKSFCPDCHYLSKKLNLHIDFSHNPVECPRPKSAVNLLMAHDEQSSDCNTEQEELDITGISLTGEHINSHLNCQTNQFEDGETAAVVNDLVPVLDNKTN